MTEMQKRKLSKSDQWYLWYNTDSNLIRGVDATKTDVIKIHGCIEYKPTNLRVSLLLMRGWANDCFEYFRHCPEPEGLIYVEKQAKGKWSCETIDLEFSD